LSVTSAEGIGYVIGQIVLYFKENLLVKVYGDAHVGMALRIRNDFLKIVLSVKLPR
tara:strand:+ start:57 stop:224 length:168 start_codon:yes stop_codon:yes gene_type:complete